ncbi:MAG: Type I restriction-modification system, specificity subunit S [Candidatus Saccharicenans subterraneus]|uniref:Type I restriction-modification system, specificity subunit S n=1 Tax=Candidatus Saccharicenans subterraneus TaxID=2508984 RepID=A0A3E2BK57_9BACT|nr:MAG: Type I restriction-modification system, specificity subunit S [Candidatus Saccharicenans subterraneum]
MPIEWQEYRIGDIADIVGGSTPSTSDPTNFDGDIPWLTPKDLAGPHDRHISRGERNLSEKGLASCSSKLLPVGAVVLSTRAPIGYLAIAKNPIATNQGFRSLVPKNGFDSEFIYYWLKANIDELERNACGSTFKELSGSALANIKIRVPPLFEQRAVAHILGTLDDKIELNRRMSETLEAMAHAIFKAWFVDFEPVRAKMEGRWRRGESLPGLPAHLYDLFPSRLVDSELGEIPEGWEWSYLGDIADVNWGDTNVTKDSYVQDGYLAYSAKGPDGYLPYYDFDLVGVVLSAIGVNAGRTWLARGKWSCIKNTIRFWSTVSDISTEYLYFATNGTNIWPLRGSAQPFISQTDARNIRVLHPTNKLAKRFGENVAPFLEKLASSLNESRTLAAIRDTLLPKLISGELRVKDAELFLRERGL